MGISREATTVGGAGARVVGAVLGLRQLSLLSRASSFAYTASLRVASKAIMDSS
jgi:hypothetical protein